MPASLLLQVPPHWAPPLNYLSFRVWWEPSLHNNRGSGLLIANFSTHHLSSHRRLFCRKRNHFLRQFFAAARLASHLRLGCWWSVLLWKPQFFGDRPLPGAAIRNDTHAQYVHRFKMIQVTKVITLTRYYKNLEHKKWLTLCVKLKCIPWWRPQALMTVLKNKGWT